MEQLLQDLRYGARMLRKSPGFTAMSVLTLALGVGAVTAMYSMMHQVLLPDVKVRDAGQIVTLWSVNPRAGVERGTVSSANFLDWRRQATSFEEMAASAYD